MEFNKNKNWVSGESYQKRILTDSLEGKINLIEDVVIKPYGEIPQHSHDFTDEIFYITENKATMIVDGKKFTVQPGDIIYVEKNESHGQCKQPLSPAFFALSPQCGLLRRPPVCYSE